MAEENHDVATRFSVEDAPALKALGGLSSAFSGVGGVITRVTSMINPMNLALGALGAGFSLAGIMKAGSEFENLQIGLAQTLQFMGAGGSTFEGSMARASVQMKRIVADAGPLPGNAMDYAHALQLAGSTVSKATGSYEKSYELIKKSTAVGISLGGGAELTAIELNRMLDANHGMMHAMGDFNQKMLNAMRQLPGMAHLTTQEFNKFSLDKRLATVNAAMSQFDDMVAASSNTWTAVKGSIEATSSLLLKDATAPLFESAKTALQAVNAAIIMSDGSWTPLGSIIVKTSQIINEGIVSGIERGIAATKALGAAFRELGDSPAVARLAGVVEKLRGVPAAMQAGAMAGAPAAGGVLSAGGLTGELATFTGLLQAMEGPFGLIGAGFMDFITRAGEATRMLDFLSNVVEQISVPFMGLVHVVGLVESMIGDVFAGVLPGLMDGFLAVLGPVMTFADAVLGVASVVYSSLRPALSELWTAFGALISSVGTFLNPLLGVLGAVVTEVVGLFGSALVPVITTVASALGTMLSALAQLVGWIGKLIGKAFTDLGLSLPGSGAGGKGTNIIGDFLEGLKHTGYSGHGRGGRNGDSDNPLARSGAPEHRGGGGRAVQDFRFSRFEISQRFEEGFNPDQIAVAFASQVGSIGEKRLQSGYEPSFTGR
jgi:hypothetical protein